jgi:Domain of unknown function (DUF5668)
MKAGSAELVRAVRGPLLLITLGLLFVGDYFGSVPFYRTWPVLLIVYGALKLLERLVARSPQDGVVGGSV